jgi:hypothetical protein
MFLLNWKAEIKMMVQILGWIGAILGVSGAALLSLNIEISGYAYLPFTMSSLCLVVWAYKDKQHHQMMMQIVFSVININGIIQWLT